MYETIALIAAFVFLYSISSGRLERTLFSGAIVFAAFGIIFGPFGFGILSLDIGHRDRERERIDIGAEIDGVANAERQERTRLVEREGDAPQAVTRMMIAEEGFRALADPTHRPACPPGTSSPGAGTPSRCTTRARSREA